jgi:GNAT superfamily N-acetyltransferase
VTEHFADFNHLRYQLDVRDFQGGCRAELRPNCEWCDRDLPPDSEEARICSYECTYCASAIGGPRCYMQDLYADQEARGRGVGSALIEAVYAEADRHNASQTHWLTIPTRRRDSVMTEWRRRRPSSSIDGRTGKIVSRWARAAHSLTNVPALLVGTRRTPLQRAARRPL